MLTAMPKRLGTVLLAAVALALGAAPPCAAADVSLLPAWKKGERVEYELVKTRRKERGGVVQSDETTRTPVTVEVLEAGRSGFLLAWTPGETRFDNPALAALGTPKTENVPIAAIGKNQIAAQRILDRVGYR